MDGNEALVGELRRYLSSVQYQSPAEESEQVRQLKRDLNLAARVGQQILMQLQAAEKSKEGCELEIVKLKADNSHLQHENQKLAVDQELLAASVEQQEAEIAELSAQLLRSRERAEQMARATATAQALEREIEMLAHVHMTLKQELETSTRQRNEAEQISRKLAANFAKHLGPVYDELRMQLDPSLPALAEIARLNNTSKRGNVHKHAQNDSVDVISEELPSQTPLIRSDLPSEHVQITDAFSINVSNLSSKATGETLTADPGLDVSGDAETRTITELRSDNETNRASQSGPAQSSSAQSGPAQSSLAQPSSAKSSQSSSAHSSFVQSSHAQSSQSSPAHSSPAQSSPAQSSPAQSTPAQSTPAHPSPAHSSHDISVEPRIDDGINSHISGGMGDGADRESQPDNAITTESRSERPVTRAVLDTESPTHSSSSTSTIFSESTPHKNRRPAQQHSVDISRFEDTLPSLIEDVSLADMTMDDGTMTEASAGVTTRGDSLVDVQQADASLDFGDILDESVRHSGTSPALGLSKPVAGGSSTRPRLPRSQSHESIFSVALAEQSLFSTESALRPLTLETVSASRTLAAVNGEHYRETVKPMRDSAREKLSAMRAPQDRRRWGFFMH